MGRGGGGRLFEVGANSRLGAYSNKYGILWYHQRIELNQSRKGDDLADRKRRD